MNEKIAIYKIVNDINNKVYIGKTTKGIESRFKRHIDDSKRRETENRPLYRAMNKYGIEHFHIEVIEYCLIEELEQREQYWIKQYNSYSNGYNATLGGDGKFLFDYSKILHLIREQKTYKEICDIIGCSEDTVRAVSKLYNEKVKYEENNLMQKMKSSKKIVEQYTLDNKYIQTFESTNEAAKWLIDNKYTGMTANSIRSKISEVARGIRKTTCGFIWKYV
jgi:group I intron endonuclease